MTLNITLLSRHSIYQSSDFRLTDVASGKPRDFIAQKGVTLLRHDWLAVVTFAGVGDTAFVNVSDWLVAETSALSDSTPFDDLISTLLKADSWLKGVPAKYRWHTFTIGAFVGVSPVGVLVSNWESLDAQQASSPQFRLKVSKFRPSRPRVLVTGHGAAFVTARDRQALVGLLRGGSSNGEIQDALARLNERVSTKDRTVSPACYTSSIHSDGTGSGASHGLTPTSEYNPKFLPFSDRIGRDDQGRPKPVHLRQFAFVTLKQTDEFHRNQLRLKPNDANVHNNYAVYLQDFKHDIGGTEDEFKKALSIDDGHAGALGNYANFVWQHRNNDNLAEELFERAISADPKNALNRLKAGVFWQEARKNASKAEAHFQEGLYAKPNDGPLLAAYARLKFLGNEFEEAAQLYERYMATNPGEGEDLANAREIFATASLLLGNIERAVELFRLVLASRPGSPGALVNLAQLLLTTASSGASTDFEAGRLLDGCLKLNPGKDVSVEAWFYRYAHLSEWRTEALRRLKKLIDDGARSPGWDFSANVDRAIRDGHPQVELLRLLADVISDRVPSDQLKDCRVWNET